MSVFVAGPAPTPAIDNENRTRAMTVRPMALRGCADIKFLCGSDICWQEASTLKRSAPKAFGVARFSHAERANSISVELIAGRPWVGNQKSVSCRQGFDSWFAIPGRQLDKPAFPFALFPGPSNKGTGRCQNELTATDWFFSLVLKVEGQPSDKFNPLDLWCDCALKEVRTVCRRSCSNRD